MIDDKLDEDPHAARMRFADKLAEILHGPIFGQNAAIVRNIVTIIFERRFIERKKPEAVDAKLLKIIELARQSRDITDAVTVGITKGFDGNFIDDRVFKPKRVLHDDLFSFEAERVRPWRNP